MTLTNIRTILVAVDYSGCAEIALEDAAVLAKALDARLVVVNARLYPADLEFAPAGMDVAPYEREAAEAAANRLDALVSRIVGDRVPVKATSLVGAPVDVILEQAIEHDADLIVMGTHGRRGVRRLILGSVAEQVLRQAPCPVLTVNPNATPESSGQDSETDPAGAGSGASSTHEAQTSGPGSSQAGSSRGTNPQAA